MQIQMSRKSILTKLFIIGLACIFSWSLFSYSVSAAPVSNITNEVKPQNEAPEAWSREVTERRTYSGKIIPPNTITYNKGGYKGTLYLKRYSYDSGTKKTVATYTGTVWCEGTCPINHMIDK